MINRIMSLILSVIMVFTLVGCKKGKEELKKGGYLESEITVIENFNAENVFSSGSDNNIISVQGRDSQSNNKVYVSNDGGKSWIENKINITNENGSDMDYMIKIVLNNGEMIVETNDIETNSPKYSLITPEGQIKSLGNNITAEKNSKVDDIYLSSLNYARNFLQIDNGDILYEDVAQNQIVTIDSGTFAEKGRYDVAHPIESFAISDEDILVKAQSGRVFSFNLKTGKENDNIDKLNQALKSSNISEDINIIPNVSKENLYFYNSLGFFIYNLSDKDIKKIVDNKSYFGGSVTPVTSMVEINEDEFLISKLAMDKSRLIRYKYDANYIKKQKKQIDVYSLERQEELENCIYRFNISNNDLQINYIVGYKEGAGLTKEDAIKSLNTELMAGKGPDILVLDNLPQDSYEKEGVLSDLGGVVSEYKGQLFDGVVESYSTNNKIYRLPIGISIPYIFGNENLINDINNINSLEKVVKELDKKEENLIFSIGREPQNFIASLYFLFENNWLNNNKVNKGNLKDFLESSKSIYNIYIRKLKESVERKYGGTRERGLANDINVYVDVPPYLMKEDGQEIAYGLLRDYESYRMLTSRLLDDKGLDYKVLSSTGSSFVARNNIGINRNSKNKKMAEEVLRQLVLEREPSSYGYISINKKMFKEALEVNEYEKKELEFDKEKQRYILERILRVDDNEFLIYANNSDDTIKYISEIDKLNVEGKIDSVLLNEVANEFNKIINNGLSVDEAVDNVVKNLELYLSE